MDSSVLIIYRMASLRTTICLHILPSSIRMRESIDTVNNLNLWMPTVSVGTITDAQICRSPAAFYNTSLFIAVFFFLLPSLGMCSPDIF